MQVKLEAERSITYILFNSILRICNYLSLYLQPIRYVEEYLYTSYDLEILPVPYQDANTTHNTQADGEVNVERHPDSHTDSWSHKLQTWNGQMCLYITEGRSKSTVINWTTNTDLGYRQMHISRITC